MYFPTLKTNKMKQNKQTAPKHKTKFYSQKEQT